MQERQPKTLPSTIYVPNKEQFHSVAYAVAMEPEAGRSRKQFIFAKFGEYERPNTNTVVLYNHNVDHNIKARLVSVKLSAVGDITDEEWQLMGIRNFDLFERMNFLKKYFRNKEVRRESVATLFRCDNFHGKLISDIADSQLAYLRSLGSSKE